MASNTKLACCKGLQAKKKKKCRLHFDIYLPITILTFVCMLTAIIALHNLKIHQICHYMSLGW